VEDLHACHSFKQMMYRFLLSFHDEIVGAHVALFAC
jgi:hypothetical protein